MILFGVLLLFHLSICFKLDGVFNQNEENNDRNNPIVVWITNSKHLPTKLRNNELPNAKWKEEIPRFIDHLYYSEVDNRGKTIYSKWIYNLNDVVVLLRERLGIKSSVYIPPLLSKIKKHRRIVKKVLR